MTAVNLTLQEKEYRKAHRNYLKTKQPDTGQSTAFRLQEKKYKAKFPNPDLDEVVDIWQVDESLVSGASLGHQWKTLPVSGEIARILDTRSGIGRTGQKAWVIPSHPGLVVLPAFLDANEQRSLVISCLLRQARHPNETNLDVHYHIPEHGIWKASLDENQSSATESVARISPKTVPDSGSGFRSLLVSTRRELVENEAGSITSLSIKSPLAPSDPSPKLSSAPPSHLLPKLRWANIGRSYHWGTKSYNFSKDLAPFPEDIKLLCQRAVKSVEWEHIWGSHSLAGSSGIELTEWGEEGPDWSSWHDSYEPDAGIVNFYQTKDTLMGHVDRSELSSTTPLVSVSLGNAAIFLIGSTTRDDKPTPLILRSGDVLIMSGPRCRRAFHGVPRILEGTLPEHLQACEGQDGHQWAPYAKYLQGARLNVNVRQVFPRGFDLVSYSGKQ